MTQQPSTTDEVNSPETEMEAFYRQLHAQDFDALWRAPPGSGHNSGRPASYQAHHWPWRNIRPALMQAGQLVRPGPQAERRVIQLLNPHLPSARSASHTLTANVQLVLPGETSPSHRHSVAAIRFMIEGESAITVVDGEPIEMRPGDLVLTPSGYWHGHVNASSVPAIWMDSLDRPVVAALRQVYQESYGQDLQEDLQESSKVTDDGWARFGSGLLQPVDRASVAGVISPVMRYPWQETERALRRLATVAADPFDDVAMDYVNPRTGGWVLPTIGCRIQMLRAGVHTRAHRHAYVSVYHVFRGRGLSIVDGNEIQWQQGDFFVIPPWSWHEHINVADDVFLFSTVDAPILDALNLSGEDAYTENGGRQRTIAPNAAPAAAGAIR